MKLGRIMLAFFIQLLGFSLLIVAATGELKQPLSDWIWVLIVAHMFSLVYLVSTALVENQNHTYWKRKALKQGIHMYEVFKN